MFVENDFLNNSERSDSASQMKSDIDFEKFGNVAKFAINDHGVRNQSRNHGRADLRLRPALSQPDRVNSLVVVPCHSNDISDTMD